MNRTTIVTGASSGIGRAISVRLLAEGHAVIGIARQFDKFPCENPNWTPLAIDLADLDRLPEQLKNLTREFPQINGAVFAAGQGRFGNLEEFSYEQIRTLMDLNFSSHAYFVRAILPAMKRQGRGDLIFIGSEAALTGRRKGAVYCASKFALRGFAQALREECAANSVRVGIINPGMVRTPFFDDLDFAPGDEEDNYILPEDVAEVAASMMASRAGTVWDEINMSPLKKSIRFRSPEKES